ncbi:hypothetical protein MBLNU459_g6094t1 [Dothideomycetes sp. NU459]
MDMSMEDMDMGDGVPGLFYLQKMYWAVVGAAMAAFTLANVYSWLLCRQRSTSTSPSKPKASLLVAVAATTAILRELSNSALPTYTIKAFRLRTPTLGRTSVILAYTVLLLVLCFYKLDVSDRWAFEDIGYRTGFITICQLPLLFLLAGKRNIIGALIGSSYERINWLHRWASRCFLLTATIHMGYWFSDWAPYGYIGTKVRTDSITKHGVIAWAILLWITLSSMTPIRGISYEFFVIQHIVSFAVFIAMVYLHVPAEVRHWIWICVGLFFFDRLLRGFWYLYNNLSLLHPVQRRDGTMGQYWALKAEFTALSSGTTRITIRNPPTAWTPGQHLFLSCQALAPMQAHPFTIASIPSDGKMEFFVQSKRGSTRSLYRYAEKCRLELPQHSSVFAVRDQNSVAIEGPYGCIRPLKQFDSVVFLAGSTGATFTMPLLRDLVRSWSKASIQSKSTRERPVVRRIRSVWIVKSGDQLDWFGEQLCKVMADVALLKESGHDVDVEISAYITCDETFTTEQKSILDALHSSDTGARPEHGRVDELRASSSSSTSTSTYEQDKKNPPKSDKIDVHEIEISDSSSALTAPYAAIARPSCGPNGTCCCTATISDEDNRSAGKAVCICNCGAGGRPSSSSASSVAGATQPPPPRPLLHPSIAIFSGRPACKTVIRKMLEQARGESAVVVCGPRGLVDDVRSATVALSDERAVHKGTGAQGVWLHTEAFGY